MRPLYDDFIRAEVCTWILELFEGLDRITVPLYILDSEIEDVMMQYAIIGNNYWAVEYALKIS